MISSRDKNEIRYFLYRKILNVNLSIDHEEGFLFPRYFFFIHDDETPTIDGLPTLKKVDAKAINSFIVTVEW